MNLFFVQSDGSIVTPSLSARSSRGSRVIRSCQIARDLGHEVVERRISIDEWRRGAADGTIAEVFACGTAAVVTSVASLRWDGGKPCRGGPASRVATATRTALVDVQYGRADDPHGWLTRAG